MDGPFSMPVDSPEALAVDAAADAYLAACVGLADAQLAGKPISPEGSVPEANVYHRTAISVGVQGLFNAAADLGFHGFNTCDGFAHGLAVTLAQKPPEARAVFLQLMTANLQGYLERTLRAMNLDDVKGRG